jgi:hypothetical protein
MHPFKKFEERLEIAGSFPELLMFSADLVLGPV